MVYVIDSTTIFQLYTPRKQKPYVMFVKQTKMHKEHMAKPKINLRKFLQG